MKDFFEIRTPFFRPMLRRVIAVAIVAGWAVLEIIRGEPFWVALSVVATLYFAWAFFIAFENGPAGKDD